MKASPFSYPELKARVAALLRRTRRALRPGADDSIAAEADLLLADAKPGDQPAGAFAA